VTLTKVKVLTRVEAICKHGQGALSIDAGLRSAVLGVRLGAIRRDE
jgi:hypothetical protein